MAEDDGTEGGCPIDPVTGRVLETPEIRVAGLAALRSKMAQSIASGEVERYPRDDDAFLLPFLRARKYKIDKAHMVVTNFAKFWYNPKHRDLIDGLCLEKIRPFMSLGMMRMMPDHKDKKGNLISLLNAGNLDFTKFTGRQQMEAALYFLAYVFENEELQLQGVTYVETFEGFSLRAAMGMNKVMSKEEQQEMMAMFMDTFPMRIRDIWVIHQPWYFTVVWQVVKLFMKRKLTKRVHLVGSRLEELHAAIDPINLPPAYGGTLTDTEDELMRQLEESELTRGMLGGFCVPFSVDDPTGAHRRATAALPAEGTAAVDAPTEPPAAAGAGL